MIDELFSRIFANQLQVVFICAIIFLAAAEIGYRWGLRLHRAHDAARKEQIGGIQGAILGLLALLLGFTFAMSVARYENRRSLVLEDANAIGTTYLRASLLGAPHTQEVQRLLKLYVQARLDFYDAGADQAKQRAAEESSATLQRQLWAHAVEAGKDAPGPLTATFVNTLNEMIDLDAARVNALKTHVPGAVWLLLLIVAACGCYACGYAAGATGARGQFGALILPILVAVVIALIADLDRPRRGFIGISQQPMIDLQKSLNATDSSEAGSPGAD